MTPDTLVRELMAPTYGCTPENHAMDVAEMMDTLGLRFMPVVTDFAQGSLSGVVAREALDTAIEILGDADARVRDASWTRLPIISAWTKLGHLEAAAGLAGAYVVADEGRVIGVYDPSLRWTAARATERRLP